MVKQIERIKSQNSVLDYNHIYIIINLISTGYYWRLQNLSLYFQDMLKQYVKIIYILTHNYEKNKTLADYSKFNC